MMAVVDAGREIEVVRQPRVGVVSPELQRPQPVDLYIELPEEKPREAERTDRAVAKITDQQVVAEFAEIAGGKSDTPGGIQAAVGGEAPDQISVGIEDIDEAMPGTG